MRASFVTTLLLGTANGFMLASPRGFVLRARAANMNVGDEGLLQDAVKEVFDPDECKVDAESAEELAACMEGAPGEPYDYTAADVKKEAPMPARSASSRRWPSRLPRRRRARRARACSARGRPTAPCSCSTG